jgi:chromosome partition protein MukF
LQVHALEICCLVVLARRAEAGVAAAFPEDGLLDTILEVLAFIDDDGDRTRLRATTVLRHLREQHLLTRIDGAGMTRTGRYALSRLGAAIAEFFGRDERLDTESLTVLTRSLRTQLEAARENAASAGSAEAWRLGVVGPLSVTASELVAGIERRQRGLDAAQSRIRERIALLLRDDWFRAIEACELLLDETASTLAELNAVLLRETADLHGILQDLGDAARDAGRHGVGALAAADRLSDELDRVAAWGASRQRAWSDYYQYVQRFVRDVVRLDPGRALSQRLRDHMRAFLDRPYHFTVAVSQPVPSLRPAELRAVRPAVSRAAEDVESPVTTVVDADGGPDLETRVRALLGGKPPSLSTVLSELVERLPEADRYRDVGRLTAIVAALARLAPDHTAEREWRPVGGDIEVEDWTLAWERERRTRRKK